MRVRIIEGTSIGFLLVGLAACGGDPPPPAAAPTPAPSATASNTEKTSETAKPWTPPDPPTAESVKRECKTMIDALAAGMGGEGTPKAERVKNAREKLDAMSQNPPLPRPQFDWCKARATEELDKMTAVVAAANSPEARAKATLGQIGRSMVSAFEAETTAGTHKLCPSAKPVPAKMDPTGAPYTPVEADWKDPGWKCLRVELTGPQEFQYEVKAQASSFTAIARRGGTDAVELTLTGKVDPATKSVVMAPTIDEKRTAAKKP